MEKIALLTTLDSIHKMLENMETSPGISSLIIISSLSGILGVVVGWGAQWLQNIKIQRRKIKKYKELIFFELSEVIENAKLAIQSSSLLINNINDTKRQQYSVPTESQRLFFTSYIADIALSLNKDQLVSIIHAYDLIREMDMNISYLDDSTSEDKNKRLYQYEFIMSIATRAYRNANNAISGTPTPLSGLNFDHVILAKELNSPCDHLEHNNQLPRI